MRRSYSSLIYAVVFGMILPTLILRFIPNEKITTSTKAVGESITEEETVIKLLLDDGTVAELNIEDYVVCVVLAEMPADFEVEALKAQAVLARTYVLKKMDQMDKHKVAAVCTNSACCQGFCDVDDYRGNIAALEKVKGAVVATEGQVLTYDGELIEATYFSCSGGSTEDAVAVWGTDVPYLQATPSPGEEKSDHYISTVVMDEKECAQKLGLPGNTMKIGVISYTDGGGVESIDISGKRFSGVQVRQLLSLKSTAFRMNVVGNRVIITVKGYGHRVGMSQYGADAMASGGSSYQQILYHYYSGTKLTEEFR